MGGTEVYVSSLVRELLALGIRSRVVLPEPDGGAFTSDLRTYPVNANLILDELRLELPHLGFEHFVEHLKAAPNAIYHQHSWTRGCGAHHLRAAREAGLRTILTIHVPGNICLRGTMALMGRQSCDGLVEERRCGACWAQSRGIPTSAAGMVASLPLALASRLRRSRGRLSTALSARALAAGKRAEVRDMVLNADKVVVVCKWLYDAMVRNGIDRTKLVLSRQGLPREFLVAAAGKSRLDGERRGPLELLFLGRFHPVKGLDVVIKAIRALPMETGVRLTVRAVAATEEEQAYAAVLRAMARGEPRIRFLEPASRRDVPDILQAHDVLVVPSTWLETGPLVVLEALATGTFVFGSDLGGISELIGGGDGGRLIPAGNVSAWSLAIAEMAATP
ncbi:glycosyltransferase, partial [Nostoc sp. NIES-2111]